MSKVKQITGMVFLLTFISVFFAFGEDEVKTLLTAKAGYTAGDSEKILGVLDLAKKEGLPAGVLENRIKEGVAKRVKAELLYRVVLKKQDSLKLAREVYEETLNKTKTNKDNAYAVTVLSDTLDRGLTRIEITEVLELNLKYKVKEVVALRYCELATVFKEEKYKVNTGKEIIISLIKTGAGSEMVEYIAKAVVLAKENRLDDDELMDIIGSGIERKRSMKTIDKEIREGNTGARSEEKNGGKSIDRRSGVNENIEKGSNIGGFDNDKKRK